MHRKILMAVLVAAPALAGEYLDYAGVKAKLGGLVLGTPVVKEGKATIPVSYLPGQASQIDSFPHDLVLEAGWSKDGTLEIRANYGPKLKGATHPRQIVVDAPAPGKHPAAYRDPDGTLHPLGELTF